MTDVAVNRERTNYETHDKTHRAIHRANTGGSDPTKCFRGRQARENMGSLPPVAVFCPRTTEGVLKPACSCEHDG